MEWEMKSEQGCSDAWVAISAFSASTSPEGRGGGYRENTEKLRRDTAGGWAELVSNRQKHYSHYLRKFVHMAMKIYILIS